MQIHYDLTSFARQHETCADQHAAEERQAVLMDDHDVSNIMIGEDVGAGGMSESSEPAVQPTLTVNVTINVSEPDGLDDET